MPDAAEMCFQCKDSYLFFLLIMRIPPLNFEKVRPIISERFYDPLTGQAVYSTRQPMDSIVCSAVLTFPGCAHSSCKSMLLKDCNLVSVAG